MTSHLTSDFIACFRRLPARVQRLAKKNYALWKRDPLHPGLQFKYVGRRLPVYSVRIGIGWRAVGLRQDNAMVWFWIGSHADYDALIKRM